MLVERDLGVAVAPSPPALPVPGLIHDNPVNPGAKRGLTAERGERPEDAEEYLLGEVERFVAIAKQVQGEGEYEPLMGGNELGTGGFVARSTPRHQSSFTAGVDF